MKIHLCLYGCYYFLLSLGSQYFFRPASSGHMNELLKFFHSLIRSSMLAKNLVQTSAKFCEVYAH